MKDDLSYIDRAIIKLKREYGKDELVASLTKTIKQKDIEIGQLKSEIDYLNSELKYDNEKKESNKIARVQTKKEDLYKNILHQNKLLKEQNKKLKDLRDELLFKINKQNN